MCLFCLASVAVMDDLLHELLSLPNLEELEVLDSAEQFRHMKELPEMVKLSKFVLKSENASLLNMTNFFDAMKKMPNLKTLHVSSLRSEERMLTFTYEVIFLAVSQNKDVVVEKIVYGAGCRRLKIESKNSDGEKFQILNLRVECSYQYYFYDVTAFVQNNLKSHRAFKLDYKLK